MPPPKSSHFLALTGELNYLSQTPPELLQDLLLCLPLQTDLLLSLLGLWKVM